MSEPESATQQTGTSVRRFADRHLALICTFALVLLATLRVYFVVAFDMATALSVIAIVDRAQLLMATVLAGFAFVVPLLFIRPDFRKWLWEGNSPGAGFSKQLRTAVLWIPLSLVVIFTFSLPLLVGWFGGWLALLLLKRRAKKKAQKSGRRSIGKGGPIDEDSNFWLLATFLGFTLLSLLYQPWLAREAVHMSTGETVVANVVGVQGDMTLLLESSTARWVKTDEIENRAICRPKFQWYSATLSSLTHREGENCSEIIETSNQKATP